MNTILVQDLPSPDHNPLSKIKCISPPNSKETLTVEKWPRRLALAQPQKLKISIVLTFGSHQSYHSNFKVLHMGLHTYVVELEMK